MADMKTKVGLLLLVVACVALGVTLIITQKKAAERARDDSDKIGTLSNKWIQTSTDLEDEKNLTTTLKGDLDKQRYALSELTNNYLRLSGDLAQAKHDISKKEASLKAAEEEMKKREAQIAELQGTNMELDKRALDLSGSLTNLTIQIAETERKLATAEGDKAFLEKELQRMTAEKLELERQFNDLAVLRAQVAHLREELSLRRRIDMVRRSIFAGEMKGSEQLLLGLKSPPPPTPRPQQQYDLNVEVASDGSVRVIPPTTNSPAGTNDAN
jgi:chromosome segregation ATPase